jgi:hypothetical protein
MNSKNIKVFEPIYNDYFFNYLGEKSKLRKEIDEKFGSNDGIVMNLVNRKIDLKQYIMKCDIIGYSDYNVSILQKIISLYDYIYSLITSNTLPLMTDEAVDSFKRNISDLKACITILNKYMIDNF